MSESVAGAPTTPQVALRVRGLEIRYGDFGAVRGTDLEVLRGLTTALVGPSGCGKTSLLRAIAGFETPVAGSIELEGELIAGGGRWVPPEKRQVGMVFQEGALFPHLSVDGNVRYGLAARRDAGARSHEVLELVGLAELGHRMPDELSGGQQQRLALARALAPGPRLLLLDEPFASLDATLRESVRTEVRGILERAGATAVLVTHDQEEALSFADRVAVMVAGRVLQTGTPEEIYRRPARPEVAEFIGVGELVACTIEGGRCATPFGTASSAAPDGRGRLLLRPEDLEVAAASAGGADEGANGTLEARRFFGHDVLDRVRLDDGSSVAVRVLSSATLPLGSRVRLTLRGHELTVFPDP